MSEEGFEKVFLHDGGGDVESCWAEPAGTAAGRRLFRLVNVPFVHAKPTYDDVIVARRDPEFADHWAWDRGGTPFSEVGALIHEDGGRYAAIVDYRMGPGASFGGLVRWLKKAHDVVAEGCFGPRGRAPGRVYLAIPVGLDLGDVLASMRAQFGAFRFTRVHPPRPRAKKAKPAKRAATKPTAKKTAKPARASKRPRAKAAPSKKARAASRPKKRARS